MSTKHGLAGCCSCGHLCVLIEGMGTCTCLDSPWYNVQLTFSAVEMPLNLDDYLNATRDPTKKKKKGGNRVDPVENRVKDARSLDDCVRR